MTFTASKVPVCFGIALILGAITSAPLLTIAGGPKPRGEFSTGVVRGPQSTRLPSFERRTDNFMLTFEVSTAAGRPGGITENQVSIVFSDRSAAEMTFPPEPLLGSDIGAEFSFSGVDATTRKPFVFQRAVSSIDFLDRRYLRVINLGEDSWAGEFLSISYETRDGVRKTVLSKQSLYPRSGASRDGGIEDFNRPHWANRVYWEGDLQRLRRDR